MAGKYYVSEYEEEDNMNKHAMSEEEYGEDEQNEVFIEIEKLQENGINIADINKLKMNGIATIKAVVMTSTRNMAKIKGFSEMKIEKIKEAAEKLIPSSFFTGKEIEHMRKTILRISTGSTQLDQLLGGGVQSMSITEAFGEFRTGKTQLSHTLCVTCQLPTSQGGACGKAAYIDTEGTFRPERIKSIAERFNIDPETTLENISVARAYNSEHQMSLLNNLVGRLCDEKQYRVVIVDSIIALFRTDYSGRGELAERQQKLNIMMSKLTRISEEFNVAIFITNQICSDPGAGFSLVPDPKKPIGGHILAHASTTRLYLKKGRGENRICKIYDSPDMPEAEAMYQISTGGIVDSDE